MFRILKHSESFVPEWATHAVPMRDSSGLKKDGRLKIEFFKSIDEALAMIDSMDNPAPVFGSSEEDE